MRIHPDDAVLLDRLTFTTSQPCAIGRGQHPDAPTAHYGGDWICRIDLAWRLHLDRCDAIDARREHTSTLTAR